MDTTPMSIPRDVWVVAHPMVQRVQEVTKIRRVAARSLASPLCRRAKDQAWALYRRWPPRMNDALVSKPQRVLPDPRG